MHYYLRLLSVRNNSDAISQGVLVSGSLQTLLLKISERPAQLRHYILRLLSISFNSDSVTEILFASGTTRTLLLKASECFVQLNTIT